MKFTVPCFVRVENAEEREALMAWCRGIGYVQVYDNLEDALLVIAGFESGQVDSCIDCDDAVDALLEWGLIDCMANAQMFKTLAAMIDESDWSGKATVEEVLKRFEVKGKVETIE